MNRSSREAHGRCVFVAKRCSRWAQTTEIVEIIGVGDGIRTRDVQIHSLALYQLSYTHHLGAPR